jgi:transposase InsO family protein
MKRSKFSEEQIVYAIRQAEAGTLVGDLCRQLGVSDATFYAWKKQCRELAAWFHGTFWRSSVGPCGIGEVVRRINPRCGWAFVIWPMRGLGFGYLRIWVLLRHEAWRLDYNQRRPHSSLGHLTQTSSSYNVR